VVAAASLAVVVQDETIAQIAMTGINKPRFFIKVASEVTVLG
jgi:hypothetical protein